MSQSFEEKLKEIDDAIRRGIMAKAKAEVTKLAQAGVPPEHRAQLCFHARRMHLFHIPLRVLNRVVRPSGRMKSEATPQETIEYAATLIKIGGFKEAISLLRSLDAQTHPQVWLFESHAQMARWNYAATIPLLRQYIKSDKLSHYDRILGVANLAAALVHENDKSAGEVLLFLIHSTKNRYPRLYATAQLFCAELAIQRRRYAGAETHLALAKEILGKGTSLERLFVQKWEVILKHSRKLDRDSAPRDFRVVKDEALRLKHWETVRDCDAHQAILLRDPALLVHVYFGSRYAAYRESLLKKFPSEIDIPQQYRWDLGKGDIRLVIDPLAQDEEKIGRNLVRFFASLTSDFYRPVQAAEVFAQLFPEEHYNPHSTPLRVDQMASRLRKWFEKVKFPLAIEKHLGCFQLVAEKPCALLLPRERSIGTRPDSLLRQLREKMGPQALFSAKEAESALGLNRWAIQRLVQHGIDHKFLSKVGSGRTTRYQFTSDDPQTKVS